MPLLFVYGTLRRPVGGPAADTHYHHRIADEIISAETAILPNALLYDIGPYPGIGAGEGSVRGEVFEISDGALTNADQVEGHPDFYERRLEMVVCEDGTARQAWAYWAPASQLAQGHVIESGDWFDRKRRSDTAPIEEQLKAAKGEAKAPGTPTTMED